MVIIFKLNPALVVLVYYNVDAEVRKLDFNNYRDFFYVAVEGGHRAVIFDRFQGVKPDVTGEGTHFLIPWVQRPIIFDVRSRPRNVPVITGSKGKCNKVHHLVTFKQQGLNFFFNMADSFHDMNGKTLQFSHYM